MNGLRVKDLELTQKLVCRKIEDLEPCVLGSKNIGPTRSIAVEGKGSYWTEEIVVLQTPNCALPSLEKMLMRLPREKGE